MQYNSAKWGTLRPADSCSNATGISSKDETPCPVCYHQRPGAPTD